MKINNCPICNNPMKFFHKKSCSKSCAMTLRWNKPNALWRNKKWLEEQYFNNKLSFVSIGKIAGCTSKTVEYFFKKFGFISRYTGRTDGIHSPNWKGGKVYSSSGYIKLFYSEPHSYKGKDQKYIMEHILIMEKILGRPLSKPEIIHHKNGIPDDNRTENLQLFSSPFEHNTYEQKLGKFAKQILFGDVCPDLKPNLQKLFNQFLSSSVKER